MNDLDRLAKEKFNGDLKAAWSYVLYEVSEEERERYMKYVSKKQLDIGMTALKKGDPNELDELANSKFNGDLQKTWDYIFSTCSPEEIERYTSVADPYQAAQAVLLVNNLKDTKEMRKRGKIDRKLIALRLSREDVRSAQKNPYKIPLLKSILKVVLVIAATSGLVIYKAYMGMDEATFTTGMSILGITLSYFAFSLADRLRDYFRFRYVKKALESDT